MEQTSRGYEFDSGENLQLAALQHRMGFLSLILTLGGSVLLVSGSILGVTLLFSDLPLLWGLSVLVLGAGGVLIILLGLVLRKSAGSFKQIVDTQGADIAHLMQALGQLRRFLEVSVALALVMILALLGMVSSLLMEMGPSPLTP